MQKIDKPNSNLFAFYGSLRNGLYNYKSLIEKSKDFKFLGTDKVAGYTLHSVGSYPFAYPAETGEIVVDLFELNDQQAINYIHRMELGAGYTLETVNINGKDYNMYVGTYWEPANYEQVESGDWMDKQKG